MVGGHCHKKRSCRALKAFWPHPDAETYLRRPGLGPVLGARCLQSSETLPIATPMLGQGPHKSRVISSMCTAYGEGRFALLVDELA